MPLEPKVLSTAPLENSEARYSGPYVFLKPTQSVWQMDWTEEDKLYRPGRHTGLFGRSFPVPYMHPTILTSQRTWECAERKTRGKSGTDGLCDCPMSHT